MVTLGNGVGEERQWICRKAVAVTVTKKCVYPKSGMVESAWTVKRHRACMLWFNTPFKREWDHVQREGDGPRTFTDSMRALVDELKSYEETKARNECAWTGPTEVIVISNEEAETVLVFKEGQPATRVSPIPGAGDDSSSGMLEINGPGRGEVTEVKVEFTPDGVQLICEF